jgi:hypothetical protein
MVGASNREFALVKNLRKVKMDGEKMIDDFLWGKSMG